MSQRSTHIRHQPAIHSQDGVIESCAPIVNGNRVVGVGGIAADVNQDRKGTRSSFDHVLSDEGWNFGGEIDAVNKNVVLKDFLEGTTHAGFVDIPLDDVFSIKLRLLLDKNITTAKAGLSCRQVWNHLLWNADMCSKIGSTRSTAAERTHHHDRGVPSSLLV
jgi:hypothetical protein